MSREKGEGRIGFVVALLLAAVVGFAGIKLLPVKVKLFGFSDKVEQELRHVSWRSYDEAREATLKFVRAEALRTGLDTEKLKISMPPPVTGEMVVIVDWDVPVDLEVTQYVWKYHFETRAPMLGRGGSAF